MHNPQRMAPQAKDKQKTKTGERKQERKDISQKRMRTVAWWDKKKFGRTYRRKLLLCWVACTVSYPCCWGLPENRGGNGFDWLTVELLKLPDKGAPNMPELGLEFEAEPNDEDSNPEVPPPPNEDLEAEPKPDKLRGSTFRFRVLLVAGCEFSGLPKGRTFPALVFAVDPAREDEALRGSGANILKLAAWEAKDGLEAPGAVRLWAIYISSFSINWNIMACLLDLVWVSELTRPCCVVAFRILNFPNVREPACSFSNSRVKRPRSSTIEKGSAASSWTCLSSILLIVWLVRMLPRGPSRQFSIPSVATLSIKVMIAVCCY